MTYLSYTSMNDLQLCPHTWLCKMAGYPKKDFGFFAKGKNAHRVIQHHLMGLTKHEILSQLQIPPFAIVELREKDPNTHIEMKYGDYLVHGYVDAISPDRRDFMEIKTGSSWSVGKFYRLMQWRIYAKALGYKKAYFLNAPFDPSEWTVDNVKIYSTLIDPKEYEKADEFIHKSIHIVENIKEYVEKETPDVVHNCIYKDCPYCERLAQKSDKGQEK